MTTTTMTTTTMTTTTENCCGILFAYLVPQPINKKSMRVTRLLGLQALASHKSSMSWDSIESQMLPENLVFSSSLPQLLSKELEAVITTLRKVLPSWAQPMKISQKAFVLGQCGYGFIVHLEHNDGFYKAFIHVSDTKKWCLMTESNPFIFVKYILQLRDLIPEHYMKFRSFIQANSS